ncbi:G-protein-coupled receptor GPR34 type 1 [Anopheles sinensis]|uniref:G-protein-coupled receptor GPR34 type 1 n=1 Tax=Anopheles sinensis TaxID=74873 RepID=A0A084VTH4_ANOSI|nr:G-protein-coupled receptor GPR34 type 1 [Anopheles sinensis]
MGVGKPGSERVASGGQSRCLLEKNDDSSVCAGPWDIVITPCGLARVPVPVESPFRLSLPNAERCGRQAQQSLQVKYLATGCLGPSKRALKKP